MLSHFNRLGKFFFLGVTISKVVIFMMGAGGCPEAPIAEGGPVG